MPRHVETTIREAWRELVLGFQRAAVDVLQRHGGVVAQYLGDGVLAYFGYPQAREDAATRAVHAGLALVEAVGRLPVPQALDGRDRLGVRVGIETGLVVMPFLPGDSLLFMVGALAAGGAMSLPVAMGVLLVAAILGALLLLKLAVVGLASRLLGSSPGTSLRSALWLCAGGEFGFVILARGGDVGLLGTELLQPVLAAMVLCMKVYWLALLWRGR